jgi:hypothetical protein
VRATRLSLDEQQPLSSARDTPDAQQIVTSEDQRVSIRRASELLSDRSITPAARICFASHLPSLPPVYAHEFAVRQAQVPLRQLRRSPYKSHQAVAFAQNAIAAKVEWMRGSCTMTTLLKTHASCFAAIKTHDPTDNGFKPQLWLPIVAAAAAALPHRGRAATLSCWAHVWAHEWTLASQYNVPTLVEPRYGDSVRMLRKLLRTLPPDPYGHPLADNDGGHNLTDLVERWERAFRVTIAMTRRCSVRG